MDIATITGFILAVSMVLFGMGFDFNTFIDATSILIVVGGATGLTIMSFPLRDVVNSPRYLWYCVVPPKPGVDRDKVISDLEKGIFYFKRVKEYVIACGWVGVLIGLVLMLKYMDDPAAIGPAMAICLLTALYGILGGYFVFIPIRTKLQVRLDEFTKAA